MDSAFNQAVQMFQQAANNLGMGGQLTAFLTPNQDQMVPGQAQTSGITFDMPAHSTYQEFLQNLTQQGQDQAQQTPDQQAPDQQTPQQAQQGDSFGQMGDYSTQAPSSLLTLQQLSRYFQNNPAQQGGQQ